MDKQRTYVFDAGILYKETHQIAQCTISDTLALTKDPGLYYLPIRALINCVLTRMIVREIHPHSHNGGDDLTIRNIRQNLRVNCLNVDDGSYLCFLDRFSTSSLLKRKTEKLIPIVPKDFNYQLHLIYKSIWAITTGTK